MYVLILVLFPLLLMFNPYLAMGALAVAIVGMYIERTKPAKRPRPEPEPMYKPGYED
jgi:hypothetical protein